MMVDDPDKITLDPELAQGPVKNRKCTDMICLVLFLGCIGLSVHFSLYGFANGQPEKLFRLTDNAGNTCGEPNTPTANYSYLYFIDFKSLNLTLCVAECPDFNETSTPDRLNCYPNHLSKDCKTREDSDSDIHLYDTIPFAGKFCLPSERNQFANNELIEKIGNVLKIPKVDQLYNDLKTIRWVLVAVPLVAMIFGYLYMFFIRQFTGIVIWGSILTLLFAFLALGTACYHFQANPTSFIAKFRLLALIPPEYTKYTAYGAWTVSAIYALLILIFRTKINLSVAVLECATKFVNDVPQAFLLPPLFFILDILYVVYWCFSTAYIFTTGEIVPDPHGFPIKDVQWTRYTEFAFYFNIFAGFWGLFFLLALCQFIYGMMTCLWYFSVDKKEATRFALSKSINAAFFYHLGSIAFGALILATLATVRIIWEFTQSRLKRYAETNNIFKCLYKCVDCCLGICLNYLKFLNEQTYLQIALTGESFINAAKDAFLIVLRNGLRFGFVHGLGGFFIFLGEILVTTLTVVSGYYYMVEVDKELFRNLNNPVVPLVVIGIFGYVIGSNFMKVYGVAADGIVHCYCLDEELKANPAFAPPELRELMGRQKEIHDLKEKKAQ